VIDISIKDEAMDGGRLKAVGSNLFRREAIAAASDRMGSPVKPMGIASWVLLTFMAALVVTAAGFLTQAHYARKETVPGVISPAEGTVRVTTQRGGIVSKVWVADGDAVVAGQPLIGLSFDPTLESGEGLSQVAAKNLNLEVAAFEASAEARQTVHSREAEELNQQRRGLEGDIRRLDQAIALQKQRNDLQRQTVAAARVLTDKGLMAALSLRQREDGLLSGEQALGQYQRERDGAQSRVAQIQLGLSKLAAQTAADQADIATARARYQDRRITAQAERGAVLTARRDGVIAALQVRAGAPAEPGRTLALVLARADRSNFGALEAELWAPSRAIGFVRPGQAVRLMYDAFPYAAFGVGRGVVRSVATAPVNPNELPVPIETREALYRVRVALLADSQDAYGKAWPLAPGMRLTADLVLEERSFWNWLMDPLLAAQKRAGV
jgi:membrane fusion protein